MTARFQLLAITACIISIGATPTTIQALDHVDLFEAIEKGELEKFEKLIKADSKLIYASEYSSGPPVIHAVARAGSIEMMKVLLKHGADLNFCCDYNGTALHYAAIRGSWGGKHNREAMTEFLIDHGAKLDLISAVVLDKREEVTTSLRITRMLGLNRWFLESNSRWERTAIHWAAANGRNEMIGILKEFGASVNHKREWGHPPLHDAIDGGHLDTVKLLVSLGADVNLANLQGETPLHCAVRGKNGEIAEFLLNNKANPNAVIDGQQYPVNALPFWESSLNTPLHIAAENGDSKMIEALFAHGAKANSHNRKGQTPLAIAQEKLHKDAAAALRQLGGTP